MRPAVLLVDEEPAEAAAFETALVTAGYDVVRAKDGEQALAALRTRALSGVVQRLLLRRRSGFEVAAAARDAELPVVAVTGTFLGPRNRQDALQRLGLVDLIERPADPAEVVALLRSGKPRASVPTAEGSAPRSVDELPVTATDIPITVTERPAAPSERPAPAEDRPPSSELPATATNLPSSGLLGEVFFGRLVFSLHARRATGVLELRHGRRRGDIFFEQGEPTHVRSNAIAGCLGRVLVREGVISDVQCRRSVRIAKERGVRQGEILMEQGLVAPPNVTMGLTRQLRFRLLSLFDWSEGRFRFSSAHEEPPARAALADGLGVLVAHGVLHNAPWVRARGELSGLAADHPVWGSDARFREQQLELGPAADELFAGLDGRRTVTGVIEESPLGREMASRTLLALLCTRRAELQPSRESRPTAVVPNPTTS